MFCPPWYWNQGPGWLSSQGVLQSDRPKISAQIGNFWRVRLQKQPDTWPEGVPGVPLPLSFDWYATKVFSPPWYWNRGPGWLSSQGVLQSPKSEPKSATLGGRDSRNNLIPGRRAFYSHLTLIVMPQRCSVLHGVLGLGNRMAFKPGCFATGYSQNLSSNRQLWEGVTPETT